MVQSMTDPFSLNFEALTLTQIIRLQNQLSKILTQRFERQAALVFSDIVGSTSYFARFGDEAGHRLQQQHIDLLTESINGTQGQIINTAGDGALMSFPTTEAAIQSLLRFKRFLGHRNCHLPQEHQWATRAAVHWGVMLTDGVIVAGDSVNLCARLSSTAQSGEIRISKAAFHELPNALRLACQPFGSVTLPGTSQCIEVMQLFWRELLMIPSTIYIEETGASFPLADQPTITFGRLASINGTRANDVILELPDPLLTNQISRWHFEILRESEGLILHSLSDKHTEVDGKTLLKGHRVPITIGSQVRVAGVLTLKFLSHSGILGISDTTVTHSSPPTS